MHVEEEMVRELIEARSNIEGVVNDIASEGGHKPDRRRVSEASYDGAFRMLSHLRIKYGATDAQVGRAVSIYLAEVSRVEAESGNGGNLRRDSHTLVDEGRSPRVRYQE